MPLEELGVAPREGRLAALWEWLFPTRCLGCDLRGVLLCPDCQPALPWLPAAVCPRCLARSRGGRLCRRCEGGGSAFLASTRAACSFDGVIRTALHRLKYRHARSLAPFLAQIVAHSLSRRPLETDLLIPVPLSRARLRQRGFNQAERLASALAETTSLPRPSLDLLVRHRDTRRQVGQSAAERRRNLRGAFRCQRPEAVAGQRVLLIDDVMTTGATLEACAEPLVQAGAARVTALVVAREL